MSSLKGTVSQKVLSRTMHELLSKFNSTLRVKELQYSDELAVGCDVVRRDWKSRKTMVPVWKEFSVCGGENFTRLYGSATDEYKYYLKREEYTFINMLLMFLPVPIKPDITHVMLESDWDIFWEKVEMFGSDLIDNIQRYGSSRSISRENGWGRRGGVRFNYGDLIDNMLKQHIDIDNMNALFVGRNLRERFQVLLDRVDATELDSVTLDDDSLELIHEVKSNTTI